MISFKYIVVMRTGVVMSSKDIATTLSCVVISSKDIATGDKSLLYLTMISQHHMSYCHN